MTDRPGFRPARGYSWPPAEPGNMLALRHGAYSPRKYEPLVEEILHAIPDDSYLASPDYRPALEAWARAEARAMLLAEYLAEHGLIGRNGKPTPATELAISLEKQAANARTRLGLDPLSRARLGRDVAGTTVDLARLWATHEEEPNDDDG